MSSYSLDLAITGMGYHAGPFETLDALERGLFEGAADLGDKTELDTTDHEKRVCSAIEQALRGARLAEEVPDSIGLLLLTETLRDPQLSQRYSALLGLTGPAVTLATDENNLAVVVDRVRRDLATRRAVLLCAEDAQGAVAVLFADAARGDRAYAVLDSAAALTGEASGKAPHAGGLCPESVEYVGLGGGRGFDRDKAAADLATVWSAEAIGDWGAVLAATADTGPRAMLASLVRAALCLHHRYLPTSPGNPRGGIGERTGLYVPLASHPWVARPGVPRRAAVVWGQEKQRTCLLLSARMSRGDLGYMDWSRGTDLMLLPVSGGDTGGLVAEIGRVREAVADGADLGTLAREATRELPEAALRAVFCVTPSSALTELDRALVSLSRAHAEGRDWSSPGGSYCAVRPIGPDGKIALVFPGLFTAYAGLGQQLFRCFPGAHAVTDSMIGSNDREWLSDLAYRVMGKYDSRAEMAKLEEELLRDFLSLTAVGLVSSRIHVEILRRLLGTRTYGALGYSLGEVSMLIATSPSAEELLRRVLGMPWFRDDAEASQRVAIAAWSAANRPDSDPVWGSRVVFASADEIRSRLSRFDRVYLTHVNTPEEAVIAGDPGQCEALAAELGRPNIASAASHVFHTPLFDPGAVVNAEALSVRTDTQTEMFTSNGCRPLRGTAPEITTNVGEMLGRTVDFPRVVKAAYLSGYRYFLEVGPGGTCTRWVGESLSARPHVAETVERRGVAGARSLAQLVAKLVSHGVPVDLEQLLSASSGSLVGTTL